MFELPEVNISNNPLLAYMQSQSPEVLATIAQTASPEVKQIIAHNIQNLIGVLPPQQFGVTITTDRENLAGLLGSAMMTGYFLSQMEMRMKLDRSLSSVADVDNNSSSSNSVKS
jgi:hypothetical protein